MQYFKHSELTTLYHVSLKTVHNWIDAAKQDKVALQLYKDKNRTYIANNPTNTLLLQQLSEKGKKYRNTLHQKIIEPKPDFYSIYNRRQILDIITNLEVHGEIPRQYNYLGEGAENWDNWVKQLETEKTPNTLAGTVELIRANMSAFDRLIEGHKRINVIDLGVGNAYPMRELLGHLVELGVLHRYIAIDISPTMLSIAERNVKEWYGDKVRFEGHVRDISYEHFDDLLVDDMLHNEADDAINLVTLLGGTPTNLQSFGDMFKAASGSLSGNDLLLYTSKTDTEESRRYFHFNTVPSSNKLAPNHQYILNLLNIDESLYAVEMGFDKEKRMRYIRVRLQTSISIRFSFSDAKRTVNLEKGDTILLLRVWHLTSLETISELEKTGFTLLQSSLTKDRQFLLTISGVEAKPTNPYQFLAYERPGLAPGPR